MESMHQRYHRETGLHAHYARTTSKGRKDLVFTRKYVWWLEKVIQDAQNCIVCAEMNDSCLEVANTTYEILTGEITSVNEDKTP